MSGVEVLWYLLLRPPCSKYGVYSRRCSPSPTPFVFISRSFCLITIPSHTNAFPISHGECLLVRSLRLEQQSQYTQSWDTRASGRLQPLAV